MNISEGFRESWDMIIHNKLRTFLTMLGMNIGVAAVIAIMATGLMARTAIMSGVESIGAALIWISPNYDIFTNSSDRTYLSSDDIAQMGGLVDGVLFSPMNRRTLPMSHRGVEASERVFGVYPEYLEIWKYQIEYGSFLDQDAIDSRSKVAVLGWNVAEEFYGEAQVAIGNTLRIGQQVFAVIGVLAKRERSFIGDGSNDSSVYIPYPILENMIDWQGYGGPKVLSLNIQVNDLENLDYVVSMFDRYLLARYGTFEGEPRFTVHKAEENIDTFNKIFSVITTAISLIAGISLLVSGIGIMNIMLVTVTERTKEIGIRKAVGAKRIDVLSQFLIEAIIVCLIGGGIGILIGIGISSAVAALQGWRYAMPLYAITLGIGVSASIGLFFGIYPAMKASRLDPVIALTKE
jgi:putative ABC transport system permease protein